MITAKDLFIFFSVKDNYNLFKEYNPKIELTYKQMFKNYNWQKISDLTHNDFLNWIERISESINPSLLVDFYSKYR